MLSKTLEDYATDYLETISLEVRNAWLQGTIVQGFIDNCIGGGASKKEYRQMMVAFASQIRQSGHSVATLELKAKIAQTFPQSMRYPDLAFSIYLTCVKTADPHGWLKKALEKDWKVKDLRVAIHEASGRQATTIRAIKEHLLFFGLGTEAQVAALYTADPLVLRGIRDMLGGLRRMVNGKGYLRDARPELLDLAREVERWRIR